MRALEACVRTERLHGRGRWTFAVWDAVAWDGSASDGTASDVETMEGLLAIAGHVPQLTVRHAQTPRRGDSASPIREPAASLLGATRPRPALSTPYIEPDAGLESGVAEVWVAGLGLDRIGADDNFFELGGRSAAAVQIADRLAVAFAVRLPPVAVMEYPTVRLISQRISELTAR
jgi:hypothetical protein